MRLGFAVLLAAVAVASGCGDSSRLPTLFGEIRPATWANGDGSWFAGGLDGTGRSVKPGKVDFGHIRWTKWSNREAVGYAVGWSRCIDARGCKQPYTLDSKRQFLVVASDPAQGKFLHLRFYPDLCILTQGWPGLGNWTAVSCRTWRPTT